ncbi:SGNH/GDSL hydrolase family protein [Aureibaculum luteum]|uniref:SGNH/GDSL hydrolase family protein n=1 Tax=Aureibaculum luteum TaxID=1548456 RepID=UPI000E4B11AD|nr:SGNH/GDSL hydrolase family protein [Aureibaculum luteum]
MFNKIYLLIFFIAIAGCQQQKNKTTFYKTNNHFLSYQGRTEIINDSTIALITSGASVTSTFKGTFCNVYLKGEFEPYNYVTVEIDGNYSGRIKIKSDSIRPYTIKIPKTDKEHSLRIFKTTEATSGAILFGGIEVNELVKNTKTNKIKIAFIGDSITCGAASDTSENPCGSGSYIDQHNAYMSYGPRVARALQADFILNSVSGIGIYRNWNDENIEEPIMPQVYENLYMNLDTSKPYSFNYKPDIISICLGTNDMSNGDGIKMRLPFNKEKFISNYINFLKMVISHQPEAKIVVLNSPMIEGENNDLLVSCLKSIQNYFLTNKKKEILLFEFDKIYNHGCSTHPNTDEHKEMAEKLIPFFKNILN